MHKPGCPATGGYGHGVEPCECGETQASAPRLAGELQRVAVSLQYCRSGAWGAETIRPINESAAELRRLHAENERIGAAHAADYAKLQGYVGALNAAEARIAQLEAQLARKPLTEQQVRNGFEGQGLYKFFETFRAGVEFAQHYHGITKEKQ